MRNPSAAPVRVIALTGAALLLGLVVTGCSGAPDAGATPTPTFTQVNGLPDGVALPDDVPTEVPNTPEDRKNVGIEACESTADGWRAAGTAVNPHDAAVTYEVSVFFTTESGTVLQFGEVSVPVSASGVEEWQIEVDFVAPPTTRCVLRGVAAS